MNRLIVVGGVLALTSCGRSGFELGALTGAPTSAATTASTVTDAGDEADAETAWDETAWGDGDGDGDGWGEVDTSTGWGDGDGDGIDTTGDGDWGTDSMTSVTGDGDGDGWGEWGDGDGCVEGTSGCACFPGGVCEPGLICGANNICGVECFTDMDCEDGDPGTSNQCIGGSCVSSAMCDDGRDCTVDLYDAASNSCTFLPLGCPCEPYRIEAENQAMVFRTGQWFQPMGTVLSGGAAVESEAIGSSIRTWVYGTSIIVGYEAGPNRGTFTAEVDGQVVALVDAYQPGDFTFQVPVIVASGLPLDVHEVVIRPAGSNPPSNGAYVTIDFFDAACDSPPPP